MHFEPLDEDAYYIWRIFQRLSYRRGSTMVGSAPITWLDIDAFQRVTRLRLVPEEIEIIEMLDGIFLSAQAKQLKAAAPSKEPGSDG